MSRREDIDNAIWTDPDFESLSPYATLLYLWSWTNLRCGMAGIYKVSSRAMTESKVPADQIPAALEELAAARFAFYEDSVLWVRTRVKHIHSRSPQMSKAIAKDLEKVPADHPLRRRFLEEYRSWPWLRENLSGPSGEPTGNLSEKPVGKPDSDRLAGPSADLPGKVHGSGPSGQGTNRTSRASVARATSELPEGFPDELKPHLDAVFPMLSSWAERQHANAVARGPLARIMMARARRPLVRGAHDCIAYFDGKGRQVKDVISTYRNWLDRESDLAAVEHLNGSEGRTSTSPLERPAALRRAKGWRDTPEDRGAS
jgi:hypothetical protein